MRGRRSQFTVSHLIVCLGHSTTTANREFFLLSNETGYLDTDVLLAGGSQPTIGGYTFTTPQIPLNNSTIGDQNYSVDLSGNNAFANLTGPRDLPYLYRHRYRKPKPWVQPTDCQWGCRSCPRTFFLRFCRLCGWIGWIVGTEPSPPSGVMFECGGPWIVNSTTFARRVVCSCNVNGLSGGRGIII